MSLFDSKAALDGWDAGDDKAKAAGAPTLASAVDIGLFDLSNALGAWLGGWVIAKGLASVPELGRWVISLGALVLATAFGMLDRRGRAMHQLKAI